MPRFLIELAHSDEHVACVRALEAIERSGSHFMTHADWGCRAGVHCGWLIAEVDSREQAMQLLPPEFRGEARVVELNRFTPDEIAAMAKDLEE